MTCELIECPICYEAIEGQINSVTTECGHKFHAKCLFQNVAHNGFGCPCCRTQMANAIDEETAADSDSEEDSDVSDEETISDDMTDYSQEEPFSNFALLGLRLFTNQIEGIENDPEDIEEENDFQDLLLQDQVIPSVEYITEKFIEEGITMNQIIQTLLMEHREYEDLDAAETIYYDLSCRIRRIINEYPQKPHAEPSVAAAPLSSSHNA